MQPLGGGTQQCPSSTVLCLPGSSWVSLAGTFTPVMADKGCRIAAGLLRCRHSLGLSTLMVSTGVMRCSLAEALGLCSAEFLGKYNVKCILWIRALTMGQLREGGKNEVVTER